MAINSLKQDSVLFPSVGVNAAGKAVIAFSVAGEDFFPSAGYAAFDASNGAESIVISFPGIAPDDGFSGYAPFAFRVGRSGDYSWATSDEAGNIWTGAEVIAPKSPLETFVPFANWGTFIRSVAISVRQARAPGGFGKGRRVLPRDPRNSSRAELSGRFLD